MQAGVPVVASTGGALPEVVGTAGITVDPADVAGFTAAMERLLADPAERQRRTEAGREQARLFSWTASAETLLEAYRESFARRAARS
jgi:glycosyltransferase involved in cell wall biosynthesis